MIDVQLKIFVETIDFSSDSFDKETKHIKTYYFENTTIDQSDFQEFINKILLKKGDWYSFDYEYSTNELNASITLIFHNPEINEEEQSLVNHIIEQCEVFFRNIAANDKYLTHSDEFPEHEGLILSYINEVEDEVYLSYSDIAELLSEQGIEYKIVNTSGSQFEGGCGSGTEAFILFIKSSVESGITWDVIKLLIASKLNIDLEKINFHIIDNLKYKRLRRIIADRIQEDYKSLILVGFNRDDKNDKIEISMKCRRKSIYLECNMNYEIKRFELR